MRRSERYATIGLDINGEGPNMKGLRRLLKADHNKLTFAAGLVLAVAMVLGGTRLTINRASANDCDDNAIIKCGFSSKTDFINKVNANDNQNGHHDLQAFYANFGLSASDYQNFKDNAVLGDATRDGRIVVNGKTVADSTISFGRQLSVHQPNPTIRTINGIQYYGNVPNITYKAGVSSIPVYVLFDDQGNVKFTVMPACGNTVTGHNVPSSASCTALNATPVSGKANTYSFTASAAATGFDSIKSYVYDFGDGTKSAVMTSGSTAVTHTYAKPGNYQAKVIVTASVFGNGDVQLPVVAMCTKNITIVSFSCVQLVGAILDKSKMSYTFTATAKMSGGAILTSGDIDFGDGTTATAVKPASSTTVTVPHTYSAAGNYDVTAVLHFATPDGTATAPTCKALVTPETVTPECKPGVPIGSPECIPPCQPGSSVPPESEQCQPPLPNTGAGNTIAIFAAVMVGGFLVYRQILYRKHKAAFVAAQMGTSPLPLGDPLSDQPLEGTPLASQAPRSFRRKRLF